MRRTNATRASSRTGLETISALPVPKATRSPRLRGTRTRATGGPSASKLEAANHDKGQKRNCKEYQQQPGRALQCFDDGPIHFECPPVGIQNNRLLSSRSRGDVLFKFPNANTARHTDNVDCKGDVSAPGRTKLFSHDAPEDRVDGFLEKLHYKEGTSERDCKGHQQ